MSTRLGPVLLGLLTAVFSIASCTDPEKRPLGASCGDDDECVSGLCVANVCLDPAGDEDGDTLTNSAEAALGTNPFDADTDGDGKRDADERGDAPTPIDSDGDGIPDASESAIADIDGDCIPDEVDPAEAGFDPNGCGPADVDDRDSRDAPDVEDAPDTNDVFAETDAPSEDSGPNDTSGTEDTTAGDADEDASPEETAEPPLVRCDPPTTIVSDATGPSFVFPALFAAGDHQAVLMFQSGIRNHYAMFYGHSGWTEPALVATAVDINTSTHPDFVSTTNKLTAFRAEVVDGGTGVLGTWSWRDESWSMSQPLAGLGQFSGNHVVLADETALALVASDYSRNLDFVRWTRTGGFGPLEELARYTTDQVFDTTMALDRDGTGAVIAFISPGVRLDAHPVAAGVRAPGVAGVSAMGNDIMDSDFKAALLPDGRVIAVWTERSSRLMSAVFSVNAGVGSWTAPTIVHAALAGMPMLGVDAEGRATVLFRDETGERWVRRAPDGTWGAVGTLSPGVGYQRLLVADADNFTWTTWIDPTTQAVHIVRIGPNDDAWREVAVIEKTAEVSSRSNARIGLTQTGEVLVVWGAVRNSNTDGDAVFCR